MEDAEEPQKPCQMCETIPENIICLSCNHIVCLRCAALVILEKRQPLTSDLLEEEIEDIECPLCKENTKVSEEVRQALVELIQEELFMEQGEEETDPDAEEEMNQSSNHGLAESQNDGLQVKETSNGEEHQAEEEQSENRSRTQLSVTKTSLRPGDRPSSKHTSKGASQIKQKTKSSRGEAEQDLDYLLSFPCREHEDEYCTHFSPILKQLICPQCIIGLEERRIEHNSKPIRKCTGLIVQSLKDFLAQVSHKKAEYEQAQAALAAKMEKIKNEIESIKTRLELKFEEVADQIDMIKRDVFNKFDKKWEDVLAGVDESARVLEERADLFEQVLYNMNQTKKGRQVDGEGILRFWLEAKSELESLETESETKGEKALQSFEKLSKTMSSRLDRSLQVSAISVFQPLKTYFQEILEGYPASMRKHPSTTPLNSKTLKKSIHTPSEDGYEAPHFDQRTIPVQKGAKLDDKRKRGNLELDSIHNGWDKKDSARSSIDRGYEHAYHTERYKPSNSGMKQYPLQTHDDSSSQRELNLGGRGHDRTPTRRVVDAPYSKTPQGDHAKPNFYDALLLNRYRTPANRHQPNNPSKEGRIFHDHLQQRPSDTRGGDPRDSFNVASSVAHHGGGNPHTGWYLESMKTINELKNFRETVRTKLAVLGTHTLSSTALARSPTSHTHLHRERPRTSSKYSQYY